MGRGCNSCLASSLRKIACAGSYLATLSQSLTWGLVQCLLATRYFFFKERVLWHGGWLESLTFYCKHVNIEEKIFLYIQYNNELTCLFKLLR